MMARPTTELARRLTLTDIVLMLVGGVIGSGIFLIPGEVAASLPHPTAFLLVWVIGGLVSLAACFAFAELGAMYPQAGSQYIFFREAYGDLPAFLYGWMLFIVSVPGTVAALAVAGADYLGRVFPALGVQEVLFSLGPLAFTRAHAIGIAAIWIASAINIVGVKEGAVWQNLLAFVKCAALAAFVAFGFAIGAGDWGNFTPAAAAPWPGLAGFGTALIAVFWAFDGWVYATWIPGEMKNAQRDLPRALFIGVAILCVVYVSANAAYLFALPVNELALSGAPAHAAAERLFSAATARWLSAAIAISSLGALSVAVMSGARVYFAMAKDGLFFERVARVHPRWRTPAWSLVAQAIWASILAVSGKYNELFTYSLLMIVVSYIAGVAAVFVLRRKRPDIERPYRCTGYPVIPALYVLGMSAWVMLAFMQRPKEAIASLILVGVGVPAYAYWKRNSRRAGA